MRIDKLIVHGFGKFVEREFAFGSNFNLIIGDNEAGKSTLMKAMMAAFFGLRTSDSSRWKPWSDYQNFSLTTEFVTSEGQRLRLKRDLATHQTVVEDISSEVSGFYADGISLKRQQDFAGREPTLIFKGDANPGGRTPEKARYDELLRSWLGLADEEIFRHTVYVDQNELATLNKEDVVERLKSLISGPELTSYQVVLAVLEKRLDGLRRLPGRRRDRKIEELSRELEEKQEILRSLDGRIRALVEQEKERERLVEELNRSEKERAFLDRMVQAMDALEQNTKEVEDLKKALSERRRDKERIEKIMAEIDRLQKQLEASSAMAVGGGLRSLLVPLLISGLLVVLFAILAILVHRMFFIGTTLALVPLVIWYFRRSRQEWDKKAEIHSLQSNLQTQRQFLAQLPDKESVEEEMNALADRLLVLDRKSEEWAKQAPEIMKMSAQEKFRIRDRLSQLEKEIERDRERLLRLEGAISGFRWEEVHPDLLKEEIREKEKELSRLELEADGLARAIDILEESSREFRAEIAPYLEEQAGEVFRRVTRGKYSSLSFDPETLAVDLLHEGRLIPKDSLSTGTQEQLYLAIRIALSQLISGERKPPFFFDDSLLNFDEGRKKEALEVLKEMATEHQIFLFTIDRSLKNVDAHVVEI